VDAVVERTVVAPVFGELGRVLQRVEQSGVEDVPLRIGGAFDLDRGQLVVPCVPEVVADSREVPAGYLAVQVGAGLVDADERGADPDLYR
jgi:hypothetical protein